MSEPLVVRYEGGRYVLREPDAVVTARSIELMVRHVVASYPSEFVWWDCDLRAQSPHGSSCRGVTARRAGGHRFSPSLLCARGLFFLRAVKIFFHKFYRHKFESELRRIRRGVDVVIERRRRDEQDRQLAALLEHTKGKV